MTSAEILRHIERLQHTSVGMSNYKTVLNDAFVVMREMMKHIQALEPAPKPAPKKEPVK